MMPLFARLILRLMGWKITSVIPPGINKCVIVAAPHTSYWDFFIGRLAYWHMNIKASFLIKKEVFRFPFKYTLIRMGGIPVDRGKSRKMVEQVANRFKTSESLFIVITPEGTRKPVKDWKKGFYYIASQANVPIGLAYVDYAKKEGGIGKVIIPNGDMENQMKEIRNFYREITPKYPDRFIP
jgi:1-acyl-sn-glycerol-3-phosphate acyltransferase